MFHALTQRVLNPPAFGLDISDLTVKFCRVSRQKSASGLDYFGEIDIPPGLIADGEIKEEKELISVLKDKLRTRRGRRYKERYCIAALPEEKSFVRVVELPPISAEDIGPAVRWEVEGVIPMPFEEIYYDFELMTSTASPAGHRDVLVIAFPRSIVEGYLRVIRGCGFIPLALELESQAISRALILDARRAQPLIIIDLGALRSSFIIFAGGSLVFTKSIGIGGRDFETAIAKSLGVSLEKARQIKLEAGLNRAHQDGRVFKALEPVLAAFVSELEQELAFYRDHPRRKHPELGDISAVYLCGGDANLTGLGKYLSAAVKRPVLLGDPFANFKFDEGAIPPVPRNESLKYTTAIGLALRASPAI